MSEETNTVLPADWQDLDRRFRFFQLLFVAVKAGIPTALASGPATPVALAGSLELDETRLRRVLRGLVWCGALDADEQGRYQLTPAGRLLLDEGPQQFTSNVRWQGEFFFRAWGQLDGYLFNGTPPFPQSHGGTALFPLLASDSDLSDLFNAPMTAHSARSSAAVAAHPTFSVARTVVDVGGGEGRLLIDLLLGHPQAYGIVFDLPYLEPAATALLDRAGLLDRGQFSGGDMFVPGAIPSNADVYILKWILHDWDDERATRLLSCCAEAMGDKSRILVMERLMPENVNATNATLVQADLNMLCLNGGAERTLEEYKLLFASAGLQVISALPVEAFPGFYLIEGDRPK